jgi:peptide/nickel transport system substrate-binding protein
MRVGTGLADGGRQRRGGPSRKEGRARSRSAAAAVLVALALVAAGCGSSSSSGVGQRVRGGTVTFALPPDATPNYIFPLMNATTFSVYNMPFFQYLMFRPLYFFGVGEHPVLNTEASLADPPVWAPDSRSLTITLKPYDWSNGTPVTANDVQFWQDLVTANKQNWGAYVPGAYPDNVVATKVLSPTTIEFILNKAYSHQWFLYNELSQITPLPWRVMDRTSATAPASRANDLNPNGTVNVAGAQAVYRFLSSQAKDEATYTTNPLWQTIDGPFRLVSFDTTGRAVFVPNPRYSGPVKPSIARLVEEPFTSDAAEFAVLKTGGLTYGYIPTQDVAQASSLRGYRLVPWVQFGFNYFVDNLNNPTVGAIFRQTYFRQVQEMLVDQSGILRAFYHDYGVPTCGPVPIEPANPYASAYEKSCPYSFDPGRAARVLRAHGWTVETNGQPSFCSDPGTGPGQCGAGIPKGAKLEFDYEYATGVAAFVSAVETMKSDAAKVGIVYNLKGTTFNQVVSTAAPCGPGSASPAAPCTWQIGNWGGGWVYAPDFYPTGGELFETGAGSNAANYSDPRADADIAATHLAGNPTASLDAYQNYLADEVPFIWQPSFDYQLSMISTRLHGATPQNAYLNILPEEWYLTK